MYLPAQRQSHHQWLVHSHSWHPQSTACLPALGDPWRYNTPVCVCVCVCVCMYVWMHVCVMVHMYYTHTTTTCEGEYDHEHPLPHGKSWWWEMYCQMITFPTSNTAANLSAASCQQEALISPYKEKTKLHQGKRWSACKSNFTACRKGIRKFCHALTQMCNSYTANKRAMMANVKTKALLIPPPK